MKQFFIFLLLGISFETTCSQDRTALKTGTDSVQTTMRKTFLINSGNRNISNAVTSGIPQPVPLLSPGSPYKTSWVKDGLTITGAVGFTLIGYELIENKKDLTPAQLATKTKDNLPFFDRGNAGYYSEQANKDSYILFDADYALPALVMLIDKDQRSHFGQLFTLYVETIGITGAMYTMAAGLVYRSRPYVYGTKAPLEKRLSKGGQRSFYGGHVAATAASTFFIAKVFKDFHPHSKIQPYLVGGAVGLSALMIYWRYKAGYHFLSDCLLSFGIGAATGILIPHWHKSKLAKRLSVVPSVGNRNIGFVYHFK